MDRGGENVKVAQFMIEHPECGPGRGSAITGKCTQPENQTPLERSLLAVCLLLFIVLHI